LGVDVVDEFQYAFLEIEMFFMIGCVLVPLSDSEHTKIYKEAKSKLQKEMRNSYWNYIENMIFDLDINELLLMSFSMPFWKLRCFS
jgi:hypothetical protein